MKRSFFQAAVTLILLYGCTTWTLTKRLEKKLDVNYTRMLRAILNKSWQQHPTRHQLYGHLPPITKTIQVRRTRHAGHCWRSRDELIRDVLLWIPTHDRAKAGRPARTYIQQLCEDTGCCPEDLPRAMNEEWWERVRDIRATSAIWWWWWCLTWFSASRTYMEKLGNTIYECVCHEMSCINLFLKGKTWHDILVRKCVKELLEKWKYCIMCYQQLRLMVGLWLCGLLSVEGPEDFIQVKGIMEKEKYHPIFERRFFSTRQRLKYSKLYRSHLKKKVRRVYDKFPEVFRIGIWQVHLPRKQRLINRKRHRHAVNEGMDSYR